MFDSDYVITGRHASRLKQMVRKNSEKNLEKNGINSANIFDRYLDVYMNAVVWGLLYHRRAEVDNEEKDDAMIFAGQFAKERNTCIFLYRLTMLLDNSVNISDEDKINRAFRDDSETNKPELLVKNMELFHSYMRGGIDMMFETFCEALSGYSQEDYMERIYEVMNKFYASNGCVEDDVPDCNVEDIVNMF